MIKYTNPEMEVIVVDTEDIILASGNNNNDNGNKGEFEDEEI